MLVDELYGIDITYKAKFYIFYHALQIKFKETKIGVRLKFWCLSVLIIEKC